jgi:hypothetical protein
MRTALRICAALLTVSGCSKAEPRRSCVPVLPGWTSPQTGKPVSLAANNVTLAGREIRWNGVRIDERTLASYLRQSAAMNPIPFVIFDPGTSPDCYFATHVRDILEKAYPCREGMCWQGSEAAFKRAPYRSPPDPRAVLSAMGGKATVLSETEITKAQGIHDYEGCNGERRRGHQACDAIELTDEQCKRPTGPTRNVEPTAGIKRWVA